MEGGNTNTNKKLDFHSDNIKDTRAREKREVFVHVEEKKTIKQSAAEFQKKFEFAKKRAEAAKLAAQNRPRKPFPTRTFLKIFIPFLLIAGAGLAVYLNWGTIYHELFEVSDARAKELLSNDPARAASIYEKLISQESNSTQKRINQIHYADILLGSCTMEDREKACPESVYEKALSFINAAETTSPSMNTAYLMAEYYQAKDNSIEANKWRELAEEREVNGEDTGEEYGDG